jgi:adenosine deaminase
MRCWHFWIRYALVGEIEEVVSGDGGRGGQMDLATFFRRIPKVELHCHLEGSVRAGTVIDLARKNGIPLEGLTNAENLYRDYSNIFDFLETYSLAGTALRAREDFRRVMYETLEDASNSGIRYREMSWSPMAHLADGVSYEEAVDGLVEGIRDGAADFGVECRLIAAIDRSQPPEKTSEMVDIVLRHPCEEVIGLGMDYAEKGNPPEKHWKAYRAAARGGLHLTGHAGYKGGDYAHPRNIETCLDLLGFERIDHGYAVLEDDALVTRCANEGVVFTTCFVSSSMDYSMDIHPIGEMARRGLKITLNSDDPAALRIDPCDEYLQAAQHIGFAAEDVEEFVLNAIDGSWLSDTTKRAWRREWCREIEGLIAELGESVAS